MHKRRAHKSGNPHTSAQLFFQQRACDCYSDQLQCKLLPPPNNQPSLVSNTRAKPEPRNLQYFEIGQEIERSGG